MHHRPCNRLTVYFPVNLFAGSFPVELPVLGGVFLLHKIPCLSASGMMPNLLKTKFMRFIYLQLQLILDSSMLFPHPLSVLWCLFSIRMISVHLRFDTFMGRVMFTAPGIHINFHRNTHLYSPETIQLLHLQSLHVGMQF